MYDDWSIQDIARLAGTTSRTLRHYDDIGLLPPSRIGANGYRYYDAAALTRLQRILLLKELGLKLDTIAKVLDGARDDVQALRTHLEWLHAEQDRLARQIDSVKNTITTWEGGETPMAENMFNGFDHTQYKDEVEARWGRDAYATGDRWWRGLSDQERSDFFAESASLGADWIGAAGRGIAPDGDEAQALAARHIAWLAGIPGTPGAGGEPDRGYIEGLGDMYVADERFAANYGGVEGATFVRDALRAYFAK